MRILPDLAATVTMISQICHVCYNALMCKMQPEPTEEAEQCGYIGLPNRPQCSKPAYLRIVIRPGTDEEDHYYFCEWHAGVMAVLLSQDPTGMEEEEY